MEWSGTTIILGIVFFLIIAIVFTVFFFFNRQVMATAQVTKFGLTIQNANTSLNYMSIENIEVDTGTGTTEGQDLFPIMSIKPLATDSTPEPTEGWLLERPSNDQSGTVVTFFNPANGGFMNYSVDSTGTKITTPYIMMDGESELSPIPPDPNISGQAGQIGWFVMEQNVVNSKTVNAFRSLYPGPINGVNQYLVPGPPIASFPFNPNIKNITPVTIDIPSNGNNFWLVGNG